MKTQTFITRDPLSQGERVFVTSVPQDQSNWIDIDSTEHIVDVMDMNLQGQALSKKGPEDLHCGKNAPTAVQPLVIFDPVKELCLMQKKKTKAQAAIEI